MRLPCRECRAGACAPCSPCGQSSETSPAEQASAPAGLRPWGWWGSCFGGLSALWELSSGLVAWKLKSWCTGAVTLHITSAKAKRSEGPCWGLYLGDVDVPLLRSDPSQGAPHLSVFETRSAAAQHHGAGPRALAFPPLPGVRTSQRPALPRISGSRSLRAARTAGGPRAPSPGPPRLRSKLKPGRKASDGHDL